eukprot:TRINITY_DN9245_c0_g1_i1.p1 TRINITY_DN9245_c0_g1~~TRINITY_DN9245_c0_g1_i1.p1  ORF type:complete len:212 (-),score=46.60 TRINITY_DN9245_c0_g1_i1:196-831(-)
MAFVLRFVRWWSEKFTTHPYTAQIMTNGPLWASGDLIAQTLIEKKEKVDWSRTGRMAIYGYCFAGPIYCWWYQYIEKLASPLLKRSMAVYLTGKVCLDQFVFEPPYLGVYFTATSLLEGQSLSDVKAKLKQEYVNTFIIDCYVWPLAQLINFRFVPLPFQALYVNSVSLGWAGFLSYVTHRGLFKTEMIEAPQDVVASTTTTTTEQPVNSK